MVYIRPAAEKGDGDGGAVSEPSVDLSWLSVFWPSSAFCGRFRVANHTMKNKTMATPDRFASTRTAFCDELRLTFPELAPQIDRAATVTGEQFWSSWVSNLSILLLRDSAALFEKRRGLLFGPIQMTPALWAELSPKTQGAIWKYLRTMTLEVAMSMNLDSLDTTVMQEISAILTAERLEADAGTAASEAGGAGASAAAADMFEHLKPMMEKLKTMLGGFMDISGGLPDMSSFPEIPERLRKGRIARLAEELAKQIDPAEFGIDPDALKGSSIEDVLKRLAEMYQKDPTALIAGAKRVAEKIKTKITGGSLNREELLAEAQEFVALFKEHPLFKEAIAKFEGMMGGGGIAEMFGSISGSAGAPSARRSAVQERLRKKLAARAQKK